MPDGIKFTNYWAVYLLLLIIPWLMVRIFLRKDREVKYSTLQYFKGKFYSGIIYYLPMLFEALIAAAVIIVIMGPYSETQEEFISDEGVDIAMALDISASMQAADFKPSRLEVLKKISADFIKRSGSNRIALYVFARHVFTQVPMTADHALLIELIEGISYEMINHSKSGGTAIGDALLMAVECLDNNQIQGRDRAIILISDGQSNSGIDPMIGAKLVKEKDINLYIIGVGGDKPVQVYINGKPFINNLNQILTTQLDDKQLKEIAAAAGGIYYRAKNSDVLSQIFEEISRLETTPLIVDKVLTRHYYRSYTGLVIFVLFVSYLVLEGLYIRRPYR